MKAGADPKIRDKVGLCPSDNAHVLKIQKEMMHKEVSWCMSVWVWVWVQVRVRVRVWVCVCARPWLYVDVVGVMCSKFVHFI